MNIYNVIIKENKELKSNYFLLSFENAEIAQETKIGQFLEIEVDNGYDNLLRKPISINDVEGETVSIIYRVVGKGTEKLAKYKPGDEISVIGPLGNGFPDISEDKEVLIVAGGIGCGPFSLAMRRLKNWKFFYGIKDSCEFIFDDLKENRPNDVFVTSDNGTIGKQGFITEELENYLKSNNKDKVIFSCGPEIMMKKIADIGKRHSVDTYLSLEEYMGCGFGACVGCVRKIKTNKNEQGWEYLKVCKDGPIFKGDDIIWE